MLCAIIKSTGKIALPDSDAKKSGTLLCPECESEVLLRIGTVRVNHFFHKSDVTCTNGRGETEAHRKCKLEIFEALKREPNVTKVALERSLGSCRPDVSAYINGVPVAIEVQISTLSLETIIRRTEEYSRKGIYVLWLLQWTPYLDGVRYKPRLWEKWIHAACFGRAYYWIEGLKVVSYRFERTGVEPGHFTRGLKRIRCPVRGTTLNLARDFIAQAREPWLGNGLSVPAAKLYISRWNRCKGKPGRDDF